MTICDHVRDGLDSQELKIAANCRCLNDLRLWKSLIGETMTRSRWLNTVIRVCMCAVRRVNHV